MRRGATEITIEASDILVAAGRSPNTDRLDVSRAGVELDSRGALALELHAMEENIARDTWRAGMARFGGDKS